MHPILRNTVAVLAGIVLWFLADQLVSGGLGYYHNHYGKIPSIASYTIDSILLVVFAFVAVRLSASRSMKVAYAFGGCFALVLFMASSKDMDTTSFWQFVFTVIGLVFLAWIGGKLATRGAR